MGRIISTKQEWLVRVCFYYLLNYNAFENINIFTGYPLSCHTLHVVGSGCQNIRCKATSDSTNQIFMPFVSLQTKCANSVQYISSDEQLASLPYYYYGCSFSSQGSHDSFDTLLGYFTDVISMQKPKKSLKMLLF